MVNVVRVAKTITESADKLAVFGRPSLYRSLSNKLKT